MTPFVAEPGTTRLADEYRAVIDGIARAPLAPPPFERGAYDERSVRAACAHWRKRMVDEYESTTVFSALAAQLVEAGATLDVPVVALRMAQDEFRHAEICGDVVVALGGRKATHYDAVVQPLPRHPGCSAEERALRNAIVMSISETYSAAYFVASLDRMEDAYLAAVTRSLLGDEVLHGRFAFHYLAASSEYLAASTRVRDGIADYLRIAFAACERELVRPHRPPAGRDDARLGLVPQGEANALFADTMCEAVVPALATFGLDAARAWETRCKES